MTGSSTAFSKTMSSPISSAISGFLFSSDPKITANHWQTIAQEISAPESSLTSRHVSDLFIGCLKKPTLKYFDQLCALIECKGCEKSNTNLPQIAHGLAMVVSAFVRDELGVGRFIKRQSKLDATSLTKARRVVFRLFDDAVYTSKTGVLSEKTFDRVLKDYITTKNNPTPCDLHDAVRGNLANVALALPDLARDVVNGQVQRPYGSDAALREISKYIMV